MVRHLAGAFLSAVPVWTAQFGFGGTPELDTVGVGGIGQSVSRRKLAGSEGLPLPAVECQFWPGWRHAD
ncbi:MAG TPA: hypothetical protein DCQ13_05375 [Firmicutes bacterium]|nr:hypothetical protein [Bacillota bacterium]